MSPPSSVRTKPNQTSGLRLGAAMFVIGFATLLLTSACSTRPNPDDLISACAGGTAGQRAPNASACTELGVNYEDGHYGSVDRVAAHAAFQQGCDAGSREACYHLGRMARDGMGGEVDLTIARVHLEQSCALGYDIACVHAHELGGQPDLLLTSCSRGHDWSCTKLGDAFRALQPAPATRLAARMCTGSTEELCVAYAIMMAQTAEDEAGRLFGARTLKQRCDGGNGPACGLLDVLPSELLELAATCETADGPGCTVPAEMAPPQRTRLPAEAL